MIRPSACCVCVHTHRGGSQPLHNWRINAHRLHKSEQVILEGRCLLEGLFKHLHVFWSFMSTLLVPACSCVCVRESVFNERSAGKSPRTIVTTNWWCLCFQVKGADSHRREQLLIFHPLLRLSLRRLVPHTIFRSNFSLEQFYPS